MRYSPVVIFNILCTYFIVTNMAFSDPINNVTEMRNSYLWLKIDPNNQGVITELGPTTPRENIAGLLGMFQEGFGVGSYYVPNRKTNERWEINRLPDGTQVIQYRYECEGPNIQGLKVTRVMELAENESRVKMRFEVENAGQESQWIAPWMAHSMNPGGQWSPTDLLEIPTMTDGILAIRKSKFYIPARNWCSYTDQNLGINVCHIFDADRLHSFLGVWEPSVGKQGIQSWFAPCLLKPGDKWSTTAVLALFRGLPSVHFASDEIAGHLEYKQDEKKLVLLLAATGTWKNVRIQARILGKDGAVWKLQSKKFDINPNMLVRCTYDWTAPDQGRYEFLAQLDTEGKQIYLGKFTGSPHGGIDTQFVVGQAPKSSNGETVFEPWTDAPFALDKGPRTLNRNLFFNREGLKGWFESSLFKLFPEDDPTESSIGSNIEPLVYLAKGERESFQIAIRNNNSEETNVNIHITELKHSSGQAVIDGDDIAIYRVHYHRVMIPSYYEGPTGYWPDALFPSPTLRIPPKTTHSFWITIYARNNLPSGEYSGSIILQGKHIDLLELPISLRVFEFQLPEIPALKTDFGFSWDTLTRFSQYYPENKENLLTLASAYLENAIEHRVTLRELSQLPLPKVVTEYRNELEKVINKINTLKKSGITNFTVSPELINKNPESIKVLYDFILKNDLIRQTFVPIYEYPKDSDVQTVQEITQQWKTVAPKLPLMIKVRGLNPILLNEVDIWCVHSPVMDTTYNGYILEHIRAGKEVWWCVDHSPPRPYANFFLDFAGIEHRIFFWQTWMLGIKGVHYWCVNYSNEENPEMCPLDTIPTNGDGLLIYQGPDGPINSIRWEIIRDGIEDYDYLHLFAQLWNELRGAGVQSNIVAKADSVYNFKDFLPDLVNFTRSPEPLLRKRLEIAECIEKMLIEKKKGIQNLNTPKTDLENKQTNKSSPTSVEMLPKNKDKIDRPSQPPQQIGTDKIKNPKSINFKRQKQ